MNEQGRLIDIIVFCMAGFFIPVMLIVFCLESIETYSIRTGAEQLAENISTKGYIDGVMYESFLKELETSDILVIPEFCVEHELFAPEYEMRTINDVEGYLNSLYEGENILNQKNVVTVRPMVHDPGALSEGGLGENVSGADTSTKGTSAAHVHSDACYEAGTKHVHIGNESIYGGCYKGNYHESTEIICGVTRVVITGMEEYLYNNCKECGGQEYILYTCRECTACGRTIHGGTTWGYCPNCDDDPTIAHYTDYHTEGTSAYYEQSCGKIAGKYYNSDGIEVGSAPLCDKVVTGIEPVFTEQIVVPGNTPDTRVRAEFLDGHTEIVDAAPDGFNPEVYGKVQTVTLSYGTYVGSATNPGAIRVTVKVMIRYPLRTCENGHLYYLVNGENTSCIYCREYPKTLTVQGVEEPVIITKGTTLAENGVTIKVTYYDGHHTVINNGWLDNLDPDYVGEQTVVIGYLGAETTLSVKSEKVKKTCSVCGYEYFLYPDNSDPGCPKCLAAIPVFTGNVLRYKETVSHEEILDELYHGEGIYYFSRGDRLKMKLWKNGNTVADNVIGRLLHTVPIRELICMYSVNIRDETIGK